jgi:hypothetical protein
MASKVDNNEQMSNSDNEEYDSDTEYVPDFDMIDLSNWHLTKGEPLPGGSWEFKIEHVEDEDASLQFAVPQFKIEDKLDMQHASKNGFFRVSIDPSDTKHLEFQSWIMKLETWLVSQIVNNYEKWFGHFYEPGAVWEGQPKPPASVIQGMYHPMIDEEGIFCPRVHIKKGQYECQSMDTEYNPVDLNTINNCEIVPLVELKGVFMKPHGYNPDLVLRGIVKVLPDDQEENKEYALFHTTEDEKQYHYYDYATDDGETDDDEDDEEDNEDDEEDEEVKTSPNEENTPIENANLETVNVEETNVETANVEAPNVEESKVEALNVEESKVEAANVEAPSSEVTQNETKDATQVEEQSNEESKPEPQYNEEEMKRLLIAQEKAQKDLEEYKSRLKMPSV